MTDTSLPKLKEQENPNIPPLPFPCGFCGRQFSRKGTYGRHLDSKKGDSSHPAHEVEALRASVVRRGQKREEVALEKKSGPEKLDIGLMPKNPGKVKKSKNEVSRMYNSKESVKEKNKLRRKERDLRIKARLGACDWYISTLTKGVAQDKSVAQNMDQKVEEKKEENHKNDAEIDGAKYAFIVASHVPPSQWPILGEFPGENQFTTVVGKLTAQANLSSPALSHGASVMEQLFTWHAHWQALTPTRKLALWQIESDRALRCHVNGASLHHISGASKIMEEKLRQLYDQFLAGDVFGMIFTDSEGDQGV